MIETTEAAVIVEGIFTPYVHRGRGLTAIVRDLNARGVPAPTSDRRVGRSVWTKGTVWGILRNPIYVGTLVYGKARYSEIGRKRGKQRQPTHQHVTVQGAAPAIVPRELWEAAQRQRGARRFGTGRPWHRPYLLSGLILCECGKRFQAKRSGNPSWAAYICGGYRAASQTASTLSFVANFTGSATSPAPAVLDERGKTHARR